jgi:hypothetical protein
LKAKENPLQFVAKRNQEGSGDRSHDRTLLHRWWFAQGHLFMDSGYTDYGAEDAAKATDDVEFAPSRKKNSKRSDDCWRSYNKQLMRKRIETVFSQITSLFPKSIHAVTLNGFLLKVSMFIIAFALDKAFI